MLIPASSPTLAWVEAGATQQALWRSEAGVAALTRVLLADDSLSADAAYRLACEGTALLWRGDFQNARQLLQAMARRFEQKPRRASRGKPAMADTPLQAFHQHRLVQSQRARILGMLLIPLDANYRIPLRRAPDVAQACQEAYGNAVDGDSVVSLRELLGLIGAHEWRKKGVAIPALQASIHPHYGVFSPVRGEYIDLVAQAPLPSQELAFDIGTGTGVLAALLAKRGVKRVIATDQDSRALACASDNLQRLGYPQVELLQTNLFPPGRAPLIVCNPPWLPAKPSSPIEFAIYDPDSRMLLGFLQGVGQHLDADGEAWLIMSDFAEHLGLRSPQQLEMAIAAAGLTVKAKLQVRPQHGKSSDENDPLHAARSREVTTLWRLGHAAATHPQ